MAITPYRLFLPLVGLNPTSPQRLAGVRTDPPVSVPRLAGTIPAATATADPELDPPGTLLSAQGFFDGQNAQFSPLDPIANSSI